MHQIAEWPEKLGMSEYAQRFAENRIDILVLSRSTGATSFIPQRLSDLARAHADLGRFDDTWRCIGEGTTEIEAAKDKWWEAEVDRFAGQIALKSPNRYREGRRAFQGRARGRASAASKVMGTARSDEHGAAAASSGEAAARPRTSRPDLRLVHRRVRSAVAKCRATTACPMVYHVGNTVLPPPK